MNSKETRRIEYVLTTHAIEKLTPSEKAVGLCRKVTKGTVEGVRRQADACPCMWQPNGINKRKRCGPSSHLFLMVWGN